MDRKNVWCISQMMFAPAPGCVTAGWSPLDGWLCRSWCVRGRNLLPHLIERIKTPTCLESIRDQIDRVEAARASKIYIRRCWGHGQWLADDWCVDLTQEALTDDAVESMAERLAGL